MITWHEELTFDFSDPVSNEVFTENCIFFDIETTGFSPARTDLYLIGCATRRGSLLCIDQFFSENAADQENVLSAFLDLLSGYDTILTDNTSISAGQKQLLCIARAMLCLPMMLILDEATSALDNESERWIQQSLEELAKNRTTITIAHRLSTIRNADEILVVADNGIAERGTHDELIAHGGIYAHYYEMS